MFNTESVPSTNSCKSFKIYLCKILILIMITETLIVHVYTAVFRACQAVFNTFRGCQLQAFSVKIDYPRKNERARGCETFLGKLTEIA